MAGPIELLCAVVHVDSRRPIAMAGEVVDLQHGAGLAVPVALALVPKPEDNDPVVEVTAPEKMAAVEAGLSVPEPRDDKIATGEALHASALLAVADEPQLQHVLQCRSLGGVR